MDVTNFDYQVMFIFKSFLSDPMARRHRIGIHERNIEVANFDDRVAHNVARASSFGILTLISFSVLAKLRLVQMSRLSKIKLKDIVSVFTRQISKLQTLTIGLPTM
jgi:hypothetical protein